jgi:hypothetical protein
MAISFMMSQGVDCHGLAWPLCTRFILNQRPGRSSIISPVPHDQLLSKPSLPYLLTQLPSPYLLVSLSLPNRHDRHRFFQG